MSEPAFKTAAVIGTGMMGPGIAATLALGGVETTILSRAEASAEDGLEAALDAVKTLERQRLTTAEKAKWAAAHMTCSTESGATVARVDLVIESAPERMEFKKNLFAHMDSIAKPDCVLATNTSGLSITDIQSKCARPERVVTTHFWNPPHLMPLVEVVKGERTSMEVCERVRDFLRACGKVAVLVKKDRPGQLGNRLQSAMVREALYVVQEGIADAEDVDLAARCGFGLRLPAYGIFEHLDIVGYDVAAAVADYVSRDLSNGVGVAPIMKDKMSRNEAFLDWTKKTKDEVKARRNQFLVDFLQRYTPGA